jgi:hypothetical protein
MVSKVLYMSYLYLGNSWSIRYFICPICIKESHDQYCNLVVMLVSRKVLFGKVLKW